MTSFSSRRRLLGLPLIPAIAIVGLAAVAAVAYFYWNERSRPVFVEHGMIVIADVDNQTGDAVFDDGLTQAMSVQLQQTPFVTLLPDSTVQRELRLMSRTPEQPLDRATARDLCRRAGAQASMEGTVTRSGSAYRIVLEAYACQAGRSLAVTQVRAYSKDEVLSTLGSAVTSLRSRMGEPATSIHTHDVPVTTAMTSSLDALSAYGQAQRTRRANGDAAAIPFYQRAVAADPEFALAYAKLGLLSANVGRADDSITYTERAYALRDRASEYERLYIEWSRATRVTNDTAAARRALEMMVNSYPGDFAARNNLGVLLMRLAEFDKALEQYKAAAAIAPREPLPISNAAYAELFLGRLDEAFVLIERALAMRPDPNLQIARWSMARAQGHPRAADFEKAAREFAGPQQLLFAESNLAIWEGRLGEYRRTVAQLLSQARETTDADTDDTTIEQGIGTGEAITMAFVQGGPWIAKVKALAKGGFANKAAAPQGVAQIAAALAVAGEIASVRPWLARLNELNASDPSQVQPALISRALVAAADGNSREGVALLENYLERNPRALELHYYLGLVHERSDAIPEAVQSYRRAVQSRFVLGPNPVVMAAQLALGRLLKQAGDAAGADEQFDALALQWKHADADFAMLKTLQEARR